MKICNDIPVHCLWEPDYSFVASIKELCMLQIVYIFNCIETAKTDTSKVKPKRPCPFNTFSAFSQVSQVLNSLTKYSDDTKTRLVWIKMRIFG